MAPPEPQDGPAVDTEVLFRQLVEAHQQRLYRFVLRRIGNSSDAEDLAQQAFVEAARSLESFRGGSELSTWLYGIAMNLVRNHLSRAPHRRYQFEDEEALQDISSGQPDPSQQLELKQSNALLLREIGELPAEMRDVLLMVAVDDLSYEEAAVLLSVPIGTVRSRVSRARSSLRKRLEQAGAPVDF